MVVEQETVDIMRNEIQTGWKKELFHNEISPVVEQVAQRGWSISILGGFQDPTG